MVSTLSSQRTDRAPHPAGDPDGTVDSDQRRTDQEVRNPSPYDGQVAEARLGGKRLGPPHRLGTTCERKPAGNYLFGQMYRKGVIEHRLILPGHTQTNDTVERLNGRIAGILIEYPLRFLDR